ncbi:piggyBac transposable element-derived protein 4-like [Anthonomus grandis grandis]|uniref:piggyBac transposable element-derived protein 4-like n=1 Tax=Anthonomus grandis grandis TaxID=2921223 RepID=UPI0021652AA0|nr:piggyBac transposable element-derived protein 4-like [Anthonomus grandis grandis]
MCKTFTDDENGANVPLEIAENEQDALRKILEDGDKSDDSEEDCELFSEHDSLSEASGVSGNDDSEEDQPLINFTSWVGKDGTRWSKGAAIRGRAAAYNNIYTKPGLKGFALSNPPKSPESAWNLLINDKILKIVCKFTNIKIGLCQAKYKSFKRRRAARRKFQPTFIAKTSLFKSGHEDLRSIWCTDGTGRDIFRATMSLARFSFLLCCLRFDDLQTRKKRIKLDKLAPISEVFNTFVDNAREMYNPGDNVTLDEMLVPFRGRCGFGMYIPGKPAKYGLKVQILADSKTHYMLNAEVYTGAQIGDRAPKEKRFSNPSEVVLRLTKHRMGTNRNVTADNWYSSIEIINELLNNKLTYVGTQKKNVK